MTLKGRSKGRSLYVELGQLSAQAVNFGRVCTGYPQ